MSQKSQYAPLPDHEEYRVRADARLLMLQGSLNGSSQASAAAEKSAENYLKSVILANGAALVALVGLADKLKSISPELSFTDLRLPLAFFASGLMAALIGFLLSFMANYYFSEESHAVYSFISSSMDGLADHAKQLEPKTKSFHKRAMFFSWATAIVALAAGLAFLAGTIWAWLVLAR